MVVCDRKPTLSNFFISDPFNIQISTDSHHGQHSHAILEPDLTTKLHGMSDPIGANHAPNSSAAVEATDGLEGCDITCF